MGLKKSWVQMFCNLVVVALALAVKWQRQGLEGDLWKDQVHFGCNKIKINILIFYELIIDSVFFCKMHKN